LNIRAPTATFMPSRILKDVRTLKSVEIAWAPILVAVLASKAGQIAVGVDNGSKLAPHETRRAVCVDSGGAAARFCSRFDFVVRRGKARTGEKGLVL
jgi:hypothetical protein